MFFLFLLLFRVQKFACKFMEQDYHTREDSVSRGAQPETDPATQARLLT